MSRTFTYYPDPALIHISVLKRTASVEMQAMKNRGNNEGRTSETSSTRSDAQADSYGTIFAVVFVPLRALRV